MKELKCSAILCSLPTQPRPQVSSSNCSLIWQFCCTIYAIFHIYIEWIIVMIIALQKSSFLFLSFKEVVYREVKLHVDVKRKREFAPRDQVSLLLVVSCSLFLFTQFSSIRVVWTVFICSFSILGNSQLEFDVCRLPFKNRTRVPELTILHYFFFIVKIAPDNNNNNIFYLNTVGF